MRPPRGPVQAHVRAKVLDLHSKGLGRNEIAKLTGIGAASVTRIVQADGGSFDRSKTEQAVKARQVDMASLRGQVAQKLLTRANELLDEMDDPFLAFNFGGKDNTYEEHLLERAPVEARHTMIRAAATAMRTHTDLVKFDSDQGQARAESLLDAIAAGIGAAAEILHGAPAEESEAEGA